MRSAFVVFALTALTCIGCGPGQEVKQEFSNALHEDAVVVNAVHTPSRHESKIEPSLIGTGPLGVGPSGVGIRFNKMVQITNVTIPEKFAVVFRCQHGEFIITRKAIYDSLKDHEGKNVDVSYREVYRATYSIEEGKRELKARVLEDYDFLDAVLLEEEKAENEE